ncbi:MAG: hypothetical protein HFF56_00075 [Lawsonibacter sp.]|nr:hypothetical protein [Lawsonibacter sp.]
MRKLAVSLMICVMIFSSSTGFATAAEIPGENLITPKVSGTVDHQVSAKAITPINDWFYASSGNSISYDCTYTPSSASVDFGVIAPDGLFYSVNCTNGTIKQSIRIDQSGQCMLAIRNNASYDVVVSGTVKY